MSKHEGASQEERERLSRLLGVSEDELFGPGPAVTLSVNGFAGECEEADHATEHVTATDLLRQRKPGVARA
jgi:hypothetical protein